MEYTSEDMPFDFDEWLASGTVRRKMVRVYNDPALAEEAEALLAEREEIAKTAEERSLSEGDPFAEIDARLEDIATRFAASVSEWLIGPVTAEEYDAITAEHPETLPPHKPFVSAPKKAWDDWGEAVNKWKAREAAADLERNLAYLAAAVVEIRFGDKVIDHVTPEQIRALRNRPHGKLQYESLLATAIAITDGEVEFPAPKS